MIRSIFKDRPVVVVLFICCAAMYVIQISHGLPNRDVVWSPDGNPLIPLIFIKKVFLDGWNTGFYSSYPDFHRFLLCIPIIPYMGIQYLLGNLDGIRMSGGYPYGIANFDTIFMHLALITRAMSILMALGALYFVNRIGRVLYPKSEALFGVMIFGFSPAIVYYVHTETLDVPMLFWASAALFCYVRALQTFELKYYIWLAILVAVSTATKDYAYGLFVLLPIPLVWYLARHEDSEGTAIGIFQSIIHRNHIIAVGVFIIAFVLAENLIWNPSGFINHVNLARGAEAGSNVCTHFGQNELISFDRITQIGRIMPFVLGWVGFPICMAALFFLAFRQRKAFIFLLWPILSYYCFTIVLIFTNFSNIERPFIPMGFILAIMGGGMLGAVWSSDKAGWLGKSICILVVIGMFANGMAMSLSLVHDTRYQLEQWLEENLSENETADFYGYRRYAVRTNNRWSITVLNHLDSPAYSDCRLTSRTLSLDILKQRNPDVIVVAEPYANAFKKQGCVHLELCSAGKKFFHLLENEQLGYRRVTSFHPYLGFLFGMEQIRHKIPNITVYERENQNLLNAVYNRKGDPFYKD